MNQIQIDVGKYYVYHHISDGKVFYVGKGRGNRAFFFAKYSRGQKWFDAMAKLSKDLLTVRIVKFFESEKEAKTFEDSEIKRLLPKANAVYKRHI